MSDTLRWKIPGEIFEDGTKLTDWTKIESSSWQWQYDTHELAFDIYETRGSVLEALSLALGRARSLRVQLRLWRSGVQGGAGGVPDASALSALQRP